jgi:hypothetical protein
MFKLDKGPLLADALYRCIIEILSTKYFINKYQYNSYAEWCLVARNLCLVLDEVRRSLDTVTERLYARILMIGGVLELN